MIESTLYLHSNKEDNYQHLIDDGVPDEIARRFFYMGCEVKIDVQLDPDTGIAYATHLNGVELEHPVKV